MTLRLYTDNHIPKPVVDQLLAKGVDIVRCEDVGMKHASDPEHLAYALAQGRAVVSSDDDFINLSAEWLRTGREHCGIFYIHPRVRRHTGKAIGILVRVLAFYHEAIEAGAASLTEDVYNQVIYIGGR